HQRHRLPLAHALDELRRALALVVLVVAEERRVDAVAVEQHARSPRVLAGDHVGLAQHAQHPQRDVLEVPDRRRADDEPAAHVASDAATPSSASTAAPSIPDSAPNRVGTICTSSREGARARRATSSRAGASSMSPIASTPPPTTTTSGLNALT